MLAISTEAEAKSTSNSIFSINGWGSGIRSITLSFIPSEEWVRSWDKSRPGDCSCSMIISLSSEAVIPRIWHRVTGTTSLPPPLFCAADSGS